jgi:hypothetical protein
MEDPVDRVPPLPDRRPQRLEVGRLVDVEPFAARSVIRFARPKPVSRTSAPSDCACRATSNAIDPRVITPVIRSRLSARITEGRAN